MTAAMETTPADVVPLSRVPVHAYSEIDRRKLRGSPLRDCIGAISFGATVVGKMHTAGLKGEPLAAVQSEIRKEWLQTLDHAVEAMCTLGAGIAQAMNTLKALESETSDFPLNLPVPGLGQPVLNLATEPDQ
jgi:hypothetical protein